ncbi:MAG: hypothetical protein E7609_03270 [Ruminococcaceae bacterium]|nr:hypothetical protein [Oscillospiraceae bacterium]
MLTKERTGKTRKFKYAAVALALLAVLVFCFASCGKATPTGIEYVAESAAKVEYNLGDTFDCTGAKIKVAYDNGAFETVDVTQDMVGNAPLTLGTKSVSVTYSENGATVVGYIPVTVKDPHAAEKATAVADLSKNADVIANNTDKGVDLLIRDYTVKINEATSVDAINTVKANFADDLATYLGKKAAIVAKLDTDAALSAKIEKLADLFLQDVLTQKGNAIANIKAASTVEEAEGYFAAFVAAVDNKLAEQNYLEDKEAGESGQIFDKIALLELIEKYQARTDMLKGIVKTAHEMTPPEITDDDYEAAMNLATGKYPKIEKRLSFWTKYITLTYDLDGVQTALETEIGALLETDVDKAAALLEAGTTIYPTAYKLDNGAYVDDVIVEGEGAEAVTYQDATDKLIKTVKAYFDAAEAKFGATGLETLKREYGVKSGEILVDAILTKIETRYNELLTIRANAAAVKNAIDAIPADNGAAKATAIDTAWVALKTWGTGAGVFSLDTDIDEIYYNLVYDKEFANVVYAAATAEGVFTAADATWTAYAIDEAYVVKYFVPNLAKLIEATYAQDAFEVKEEVAKIPAIGDIVYSYTDADSNAVIETAEKALAAYLANYGEEVYNEYFVVDGVDATKDTIVAARAQHTKLIEMAAAANAAIDLYEGILKDYNEGAGRDVIRSDYESAEAPLKKAYKLYCDFAKENTTTAGVIYTDVIQDSKDATTGAVTVDGNGNEKALVGFMDTYVALAYAEERHVQSDKIINAAWLIREGEISTDETAFRKLLTECKNFYIDFLSTNAQFNYKDVVTIDGESVTKSNFNYDELLEANLAVVKEAANTVAEAIKVASYDNGQIMIPDAENEGQFIVIYPVGI